MQIHPCMDVYTDTSMKRNGGSGSIVTQGLVCSLPASWITSGWFNPHAVNTCAPMILWATNTCDDYIRVYYCDFVSNQYMRRLHTCLLLWFCEQPVHATTTYVSIIVCTCTMNRYATTIEYIRVYNCVSNPYMRWTHVYRHEHMCTCDEHMCVCNCVRSQRISEYT